MLIEERQLLSKKCEGTSKALWELLGSQDGQIQPLTRHTVMLCDAKASKCQFTLDIQTGLNLGEEAAGKHEQPAMWLPYQLPAYLPA